MAVADVPLAASAAPPVSAAHRTAPIKVWAVVGALILAFEAWVILRWITGPFWQRVPTGPSTPPTWMKVNLVVMQVISIPACLGLLYATVVRPWRRERRVGSLGILALGCLPLSFQDPLSSFGGHWFTYNTWMLNRGSWTSSIPGWQSFGQPGAMFAEPILFTPTAFTFIFLIGSGCSTWAMRRAHARRPASGRVALLGVAFLAALAFDFVLEGLIWLPGGVFEYPGGRWGIFRDTYHKFPLAHMLIVGVLVTGISWLRAFLDRDGLMAPERGAEQIRGDGRRVVLRALAVAGWLQLWFLVAFTIPSGIVGGLNSTAWPKDLQQRSYFLMGVCGAGTPRACPGAAVPHTRNDDSGHGRGSIDIAPGGKAVAPPGVSVPPAVAVKAGS